MFTIPSLDPDQLPTLQRAIDADRHAVRPFAFPGRRDLYIKPDGSVWAVNSDVLDPHRAVIEQD